jgi:type VI secretion system secreted protein Hcp
MSAYIKFANIAKGDSQAQDHSGDAGWINLLSVSFGTTRSIKTPTGAGVTREAAKPDVSEIVVTKTMDSTSPSWLQESLTGSKAGTAVIDLVQTGAKKLQTYLTVTLTNVLVSGYQVSSSGDRPTESVTLNFTKIEFKYTPYDDSGAPGTPTSATYNIATGTP